MSITHENNALQYQLALTLVPGIGPKRAAALLTHFGAAEEVFKASLRQLMRVEGMGEVGARAVRDADVLARAGQEMRFAEQHGIQCLFMTDKRYPARLSHCADAPVMLFYKGHADLNTAKIIAVIGTRKNTAYGQRLCEELIEGLRGYDDLVIVSGLAYGIDAIAHQSCVHAQIPTVGVLAHGLDRIYPAAHRSLARQMCVHGGLLTEFPSGTSPDKTNFPVRNRVVAGMSDVTVVVESGPKGGAVITAYLAAGYSREVAAFPGRAHDPGSLGCNRLIRDHVAALITGPEDLVAMMGWVHQPPNPAQQLPLPQLLPGEQAILDLLSVKDHHADELLHATKLTNTELAAILLNMEMQGRLQALPGKHYRIRR